MPIEKYRKNIILIAPPLIGDCVLLLPLINVLTKNFRISIITNDYTKNLFDCFKLNLRINGFQFRTSFQDYVIDFLGNEPSRAFLKFHPFCWAAGFPDNEFEYNFNLKLPGNFHNEPAHKIFTQVLAVFNINEPKKPDFSFGLRWKKSNQKQILLAPGAGCIERSWSISKFLLLAKKLQTEYEEVSFLLGPKEKSFLKIIPKDYRIIYSDNFLTTLEFLRNAKFVISNEGGFMHFAAAFGIPLLGIFKVAKIKNWFPYTNPNQQAIGYGENNYEEPDKFPIPFFEVYFKSCEIYEKI